MVSDSVEKALNLPKNASKKMWLAMEKALSYFKICLKEMWPHGDRIL